MFTPQQIDQISFTKSTFGGYNMQQVDEFLEPLTEDYVTLYKENALLKSKMRVLVGKLEEYRKNEASMKEAVVNAQKTCDKMVAEAEAKCAKMLGDASSLATTNTQTSETQMAAEMPVWKKPAGLPLPKSMSCRISCAAAFRHWTGSRKTMRPQSPLLPWRMPMLPMRLPRILKP